nr:EthD domain-containing protein [Dietzia aerolata]
MVVVWSDGRAGGAAQADSGALIEAVAAAVDAPLAGLGVTEYLVNVRDEQVAGAMIDVQVTPLPVLAAVRVRVPAASAAACAEVIEALGALGAVSAWSVTASEPLPVERVASEVSAAPGGAPGGAHARARRSAGMANLAFLRRPERIGRDEWLRIWLEDHTRVAIDTQSTTGYTQHVVVRALTEDAPVIDGIVEEIFPIEAARDLGVFFDSRGSEDRMAANVRAMTTSTARFLDQGTVDAVPTGRYVMSVRGPVV